MKTRIILLLFVMTVSLSAFPQADPARAAWESAGVIKMQKNAIKKQELGQAAMAAGHIMIRSKVKDNNRFKEEFNEYLNMFHDTIAMVAEIYGCFYEVKELAKNIKNLNSVMAAHPSNIVASSMSLSGSSVYGKLIDTVVSLADDIRQLCFGDVKLTQKEKMSIIDGMRPKLRILNRQLKSVAMVIQYTEFVDVWRDMVYVAHRIDAQTKRDIMRLCLEKWRNSAWSVTP